MRTLCRSILSLAILLVLNFISLGTPAIAQQYIITDLGTLGGTQGYATAVNGSGQVVGDCNPTGLGAPHAFWWTQEGGMVDIGTLGGTRSFPTAVNASGQVVGYSKIAGDAVEHAFSWTKEGGMVDLGTLGGTHSGAYAVNDSGQIVGYSSLPGDTVTHAVLWQIQLPNQPPTAICQDVTVPAGSSCTAPASIDNGSYDPDADPITLTQSPAEPYPLGITLVTLTVTDDQGASSQCTGAVSVVDNTPPMINSLLVNPSVLWPPNHKMVPVSLVSQVYDTCDPNPICGIVSINSNEPDNGLGDGDTSPDWGEITGNLKVSLRAERSGNGSGRVYTITVKCSDTSGNSSSGTAMVTVPHDQAK